MIQVPFFTAIEVPMIHQYKYHTLGYYSIVLHSSSSSRLYMYVHNYESAHLVS